MTKHDRLLYILNLLRSRRTLNATALAGECSVTERTIYRDIISLSEAQVPVYYDRGYKLASDSFLPPLNFNFEEYAALKLALESSPLRRTAKYGEALRRVRAKVEAGLNQSVREKRRTAVDATWLDIASTEDPVAGERFFAVLESACSEHRTLEIDYDSVSSGPGKRQVDPYFIIFRAHAFYFVAYCHTRRDFRTFRIDRLRGVTTTEQRFTRQKGVSVKTYFEGSWQLYTGEPVEVRVRFTGTAARVIVLGKHHPGEWVEKLPDGSVIYTATVRGLEEFYRWVVAFGESAEVLEPNELKQDLGRLGAFLQKTYGRN
ncbi:MAG: YafY family transcriptional regulator [candidate division Zixibacteria bacterium]|nr:YafY family transcriptional regulator [candidate division Zixibacteria bacterium]